MILDSIVLSEALTKFFAVNFETEFVFLVALVNYSNNDIVGILSFQE